MGTFREDMEIRASRIIKLWVAEGFVKPDGTRIIEEIAEGYLKELVDRNLILVGRHRENGKIRSCCIHDLLRDLCWMVSEKEQFFCSVREGALRINGERRIIFREFMSRDDNCQTFDALDSALLVRSLMCRGTKLPVEFRLLRVLNMANNASPETIFHNLNLRFFSYQPLVDLNLVVLPSSISLIWNLQTLAIQGEGTKLVIAPLEIWNLTQLRHVECTKVYLPDPPPHGRQDDEFAVLGNLQTLTKALNLKLSEEVCKRIPNINKLHLILDDKSEGYDECLFGHLHNLSSLHKLQSLNIVSLVENLPFCTGWLKHSTLPRSLNKLSLTKCSLDQNDLTIIGSLPQLGVLKLENSIVEQDWSPVRGQFISLKVLRVANCCLRRWNADSFHFPVLKELILKGLWNLEEIPSGIGEIPTLELISVFDCSESARISATAMKKEQESLGNDGLQIQDGAVMWALREKIKIAYVTYQAALRFIDQGLRYKSERSLDYI